MRTPAVLLVGLAAVLALSAAEKLNFVRTGDCEVRPIARAQCPAKSSMLNNIIIMF